MGYTLNDYIDFATLATTLLIFSQVMVAAISLVLHHRRQKKMATLAFLGSIEGEMKARRLG